MFVYLYISNVEVLCSFYTCTSLHTLHLPLLLPYTQIKSTSTTHSVPFHLYPAQVGMLLSLYVSAVVCVFQCLNRVIADRCVGLWYRGAM